MNSSNLAKAAALAALLVSAPLQAGGMEIVGGSSPAGYVANGFVQEVVIVRGPHRGAYAGRPGGAHAYRLQRRRNQKRRKGRGLREV